jgi:hypothetical protein
MFSFSWKGRGASPRLPPVDLPSHTMQLKTADSLRAGISRALHIPLGQIKPATCCSIQSSSWMSHRLIMSLWDGGRKNKKGRGTSPSWVSWWKQFLFPPQLVKNLVNNFSGYFRKRYINIFQSGWSFSLSLYCSRSAWDRH